MFAGTQFRPSRFNSKLVRLKVAFHLRPHLRMPLFQFQTGSIKSLQNSECLAVEERFQFQTGSIKRLIVTDETPRSCFNSKLVRLKVFNLTLYVFDSFLFQFQTGSIKSNDDGEVIDTKLVFQFQTGSIKSLSNLQVHNKFGEVSIPNWFD